MAASEVPSTPTPRKRGAATTVKLRSGGTVTLSLSIDLFAMSTDDRQYVLDLVDRLAAYGKESLAAPAKNARAEKPSAKDAGPELAS